MKRRLGSLGLAIAAVSLVATTAVAAPLIHRQKLAIAVPLGASLDLDTARTDRTGKGDLRVTVRDGVARLHPTAGAVVKRGSHSRPSYASCLNRYTSGRMSAAPVLLEQLFRSTWLCARTSAGRIARFQIVAKDQETHDISVRFVTWERGPRRTRTIRSDISDRQLADAVRFRDFLGLDARRSFVLRTFIDGQYSSEEWGIPLNADELQDLDQRLLHRLGATDAIDRLQSQLRAALTGGGDTPDAA